MTVDVQPRRAVRYRGLFPTWEGNRPLTWFFAEQLLEARAESDFPTNQCGKDEDVNVYLAGLLACWAAADQRGGVLPGAEPLLIPPAAPASRRCVAEHYRRQADHRLLALGLFDRGDLVRRNRLVWRMSADETRRRDLAVAATCYELAADLAGSGRAQRPDLTAIWRRLAAHLPDYVHVLQTLARRRFGLGARIGDAELARLLAAD